MKFFDEATITVQAGHGGHGCLSFRREKYIERGGPDGGDGGDGGSVYLKANRSINTLVDFHYQRHHRAENGRTGSGKQCTGKSGVDCIIEVPAGTTIVDTNTQETLGDLIDDGQSIKVAQGGFHGLGNTRFKSSINQSPRRISKGGEGEQRTLQLELKLLADVGLLGAPNAGKSTLIRAVSAATPKIADYPFTTLVPHLGVVSTGAYRSFVMADIPGLIEGAADGAGLGVRFLKHLNRTRLLLHIIDIAPIDGSDPVASADTIIEELKHFNAALWQKPRWLVFNKSDQLSEADCQQRCQAIKTKLDWQDPSFTISAIRKTGTDTLCYKIMDYLTPS